MLPDDFPEPVAAWERSENAVACPATLLLRSRAATTGAEGRGVEAAG